MNDIMNDSMQYPYKFLDAQGNGEIVTSSMSDDCDLTICPPSMFVKSLQMSDTDHYEFLEDQASEPILTSSMGEGHSDLTIYKTSISRDQLKLGIYEPKVTMVREVSLDEAGKENFYQPVVALLSEIYSESVEQDSLLLRGARGA